MTGSSDDSDTAPRRKKARRSCLNCQRSHRTCGKYNRTQQSIFGSTNNADSSISGNERPCMECKRRGMTETCVDGNRKTPKYLYDICNKSPPVSLYNDTSNTHSNWSTYGGLSKDTDYCLLPCDPVNQSGVTSEEQVHPRRYYCSGQEFDDFIDPAILHIESPTLLLNRQTVNGQPQAKVGFEAQSLTADIGSLLRPPVESIGSHGMESSLGGKTIGFTISSGWSSTFLPYGMSEDSTVSKNVS